MGFGLADLFTAPVSLTTASLDRAAGALGGGPHPLNTIFGVPEEDSFQQEDPNSVDAYYNNARNNVVTAIEGPEGAYARMRRGTTANDANRYQSGAGVEAYGAARDRQTAATAEAQGLANINTNEAETQATIANQNAERRQKFMNQRRNLQGRLTGGLVGAGLGFGLTGGNPMGAMAGGNLGASLYGGGNTGGGTDNTLAYLFGQQRGARNARFTNPDTGEAQDDIGIAV